MWWVTAWRPSMRPAIARMSEPPQTVATVTSGLDSAVFRRWGRSDSSVRASKTGIAAMPSSPSCSVIRPAAPGTMIRSARSGSSLTVARKGSAPEPEMTSRGPSAEASSTLNAPDATCPPAQSTS
ncbi:hypothetical protein D3C87_1351500 [compost metagenome]